MSVPAPKILSNIAAEIGDEILLGAKLKHMHKK